MINELKIGTQLDFERGNCSHWIGDDFHSDMVDVMDKYKLRKSEVPLQTNQETKEVSIDYGALCLYPSFIIRKLDDGKLEIEVTLNLFGEVLGERMIIDGDMGKERAIEYAKQKLKAYLNQKYK